MRFALAIVALAALACLILQCHRLHLTRTFYLYVATEIVFTSVCLAIGVKKHWSGNHYFLAYYGAFVPLACAALFLTAQFCKTMPGTVFAAIVCLSSGIFALALGNSFLDSLNARHMLATTSVAHIASHVFLIFCGIVGLVSLAFPDGMIRDVIRAVISLFWVATGAWGLFEANLYLRARATVVAKLSATPIVLAIVAFGFLSYFLHHQAELSRQPNAHLAAVVHATEGQ